MAELMLKLRPLDPNIPRNKPLKLSTSIFNARDCAKQFLAFNDKK